MWTKSEPLQCVTLLPFILRMTIASLNFWRTRYCARTMCSDTFCAHKNTFQSLARSNHQCPQCSSMCQVHNIPFDGKTSSFFLKSGKVICGFELKQKSIHDVIGVVNCPTCPNKKCVHISTNKNSTICDCKMCKACSHVLIIFLRNKKRLFLWLVVMVQIALQKWVATTEKETHLYFW